MIENHVKFAAGHRSWWDMLPGGSIPVCLDYARNAGCGIFVVEDDGFDPVFEGLIKNVIESQSDIGYWCTLPVNQSRSFASRREWHFVFSNEEIAVQARLMAG